VTWRPTAALLRVSVLPAALALLAVLVRRPDLVLLAAPLALAALPLLRRPGGSPAARLELSQDTVAEGDQVVATLRVDDVAGAQTVALVLDTVDRVQPANGGRLSLVSGLSTGAPATSVDLQLTAQRWGWSAVGPGSVLLSACGGLLRAGPERLSAVRLRVMPLSAPYTGSTTVHRAGGVVGLHRSTRPGEGSELAGVRPFTPGDRIRRINWRTSLRGNGLQVNATTTERDATVLLLLDARYDGGTSGPYGGQASGIDVAVRATAALAAFYLDLGDRVGLVTYTGGMRSLGARSGRAQLHRLLAALLDTSAPRAGGAEPRMPSPPDLDPRALVLLVSPLVGRSVFERAAALARAGHTVLVVDTLPADALPPARDAWDAPVAALWQLERGIRIGQLASLGVPVVRWHGSGSLDAVLAELARAASRTGVRR
jgi:uncharacterized protein (DUF58 family)